MKFIRLSFIGIFFVLVANQVNGQVSYKNLDKVIAFHKSMSIDSMEQVLLDLKSQKLKQFFNYEIEFLKKGKRVNSSFLNLDGLKGRDKYVGKYLLADLISRIERNKDSLIFNYYLDSYSMASSNNDTLIINEVLKRINRFLFINGSRQESFNRYLNTFHLTARDSVDRFYVDYYRIGYEFLEVENDPQQIDSLKLERFFARALKNAPNSFFKGSLYGYQSIFYSACFDNQTLANYYNKKAIRSLKNIPYHYAQYVISGIEFNNAIILFENGKHEAAIPIFKKVLKKEKQQVYRMHGYDWLHKCYDSLGDYGNAYRYFKKVGEVKDSLSLLEHAREIKQIETQYDFTEKEKELAQLANEKNRVQSNFNTLIPFFGIALFLALVALFLYRKYRKRSDSLQEEKEETLKRIDQLKKIVIKNHIVLKDKTKVYISDLVYVKAEDHYLKLYLSTDKNHLVRGKIKDIKKQLPPNFIQCHRSYIVNANFIKQANRDNLIMIGGDSIPLSRSFKDKF